MVEEKVKEYHYITDSKGKRVLDNESENDRMKEYLSRYNLYPFDLNQNSVNKLVFALHSNINIHEPTVFTFERDIHKSLFSSLLLLANKENIRLYGDKAPYGSYAVTDISYITQQFLSGEYHDVSMEFDYTEILFVMLNVTDYPHMYHAYGIRNLAESRKAKGKYTFFFFLGEYKEFFYDKWKLDEDGMGRKGILESTTKDGKPVIIDNRNLTSLTKYVKVVNMNDLINRGEK